MIKSIAVRYELITALQFQFHSLFAMIKQMIDVKKWTVVQLENFKPHGNETTKKTIEIEMT